MRYDLSAGLVIGAALSKNEGKISESDLENIVHSIRQNAPKYCVDYSRDSIYNGIEANRAYFMVENNEIVLNESYREQMARISRYFYEVLDEEVRHAIDLALA